MLPIHPSGYILKQEKGNNYVQGQATLCEGMLRFKFQKALNVPVQY